jgi:hypothetical protein
MEVLPEENVFEAFHSKISFKAAATKVTNKIQIIFINMHEQNGSKHSTKRPDKNSLHCVKMT